MTIFGKKKLIGKADTWVYPAMQHKPYSILCFEREWLFGKFKWIEVSNKSDCWYNDSYIHSTPYAYYILPWLNGNQELPSEYKINPELEDPNFNPWDGKKYTNTHIL